MPVRLQDLIVVKQPVRYGTGQLKQSSGELCVLSTGCEEMKK